MTIIDAIKKGLKAAGVNEKYAVKVQKLFKIEKDGRILILILPCSKTIFFLILKAHPQ